ncbi:lysophospholipid acyltransferase family protein [Alkalilimnicola sp. S0819]|uniref:lysophospholipid acyltransferase family protein n=1 Tax=Alkalilimnicola sp. S0819 TaxID=2613922 RepID=UPI0012619015|nr:lysophospholipid acyltransferase family protein [Alkalilimnicola sp. S0819]KAB7623168.1 1-acyl-sn-glycerol-3-phosphate acyltransferase [Alkalilimnicola sp. S0819]MPQ17012.1 1-acyl-sn-glycerol-3-phosphate acyltransferase [Alkalilimnicola sp. S0819]
MKTIRRLWRFPLVLLLVLFGGPIICLAVAWDGRRGRPLHSGAGRRAQVLWSRWMCALLGVRVTLEGEPLGEGAALIVTNHVSWIDIPVQASVWPVGFLSKSEVRDWPIVGSAATGLGTLYIARGRSGAAADATRVMAERMRAGHRVLFYPEGTTSDGRGLLPLRPRLFQAAVDAGAPVRPGVIRYLEDGRVSELAPFINDMSLAAHVWRVLGVRRLDVRLHLGPPLESAGRSRSELALEAREYMAAYLASGTSGSASL